MLITRICIIVLVMCFLSVDATRIAHIEPISKFSVTTVSQNIPHVASYGDIMAEFANQASASLKDTSSDRIRVKFSAYDLEEFDLTLSLDSVISERTRVIAGVPGDEEQISVKPSTYSATVLNEDGTSTIATFTRLPDGQVDGMVVRDGHIYVVTPIAFLEAEADAESTPAARSNALSRLSALKARSHTGMAIYRMSDLETHDENGAPYYGCKAVSVDEEQASGHDEHDHVDIVSPSAPFFAELRAATAVPGMIDALGRVNDMEADRAEATGVGRKPLLKRWTDCFPGADGNGKIAYLDLVVDIGAALGFSSSTDTVNISTVMTRLQGLTAQMNVFYYGQLGLRLKLNKVVIRTGPSNEVWNVYAASDKRWAQKNITNDAYLKATVAYRSAEPVADYGAAQQFLTRAFVSDVVGQAYVGQLCKRNYSTGYSSVAGNALITVSHEFAHLHNALHTFETCKAPNGKLKYKDKTGGIMDYSNGVLGPESDSPDEVGFHSLCNKEEMCTHIRAALLGSGNVPVAQCFADHDPRASTCGDGLVEGEEECDVYGGDTACCVKCKFVSGATCAMPGACCVNCKTQPATTACESGGFCAADGTCKGTTCTQYSNISPCGTPVAATPCTEKCRIDDMTTCALNNKLSGVLCPNGACSDGVCEPITYSWRAEERACTCTQDTQGPITRFVHCIASDGRIVAGSYCDAASKPSTQMSCCRYGWRTGSYGQCSNTCGTGTRTRTVTCHNEDRGGVAVADSFCDAASKPAASEACTSQLTCLARWRCAASASADFTQAPECMGSDEVGYGPCTVNCNTAAVTRVAKCYDVANQLVVADTICLVNKPTLTRTCTAPTTVSAVTVTPTSVVAGKTVSVSWCYYGAAQQLKLSLANADGTYTGLNTADATTKKATVTLPISSKRDGAIVRLVTADGATASSPAFTITSRCPSLSCGANGACDDALGVCVCTGGWSGDTCSVSPCASAGCLNGGTCSNVGDKAGQCQCPDAFTGARCQQPVSCDADACANGGWVAVTQGTCASKCTCVSPWTGNTCAVCSMTCQQGGRPNDSCDACVCPRGLTSDDCSCRAAYAVLNFNTLPRDVVLFSDLLRDDLSVLTGLPRTEVDVDVTASGSRARVLVILRFCPASAYVSLSALTSAAASAASASAAAARVSVAAVTNMDELYLKWEASLQLINSGSSILHRGDAAIMANGLVSVTALHDPLCVGDGCPSGPDPFVEGGDDDKAPMIIGIVVGVAAVVLVVLVVYCMYSRKLLCWSAPKQPTATEMSAPRAPMAPAAPHAHMAPVPPKMPPVPMQHGSMHPPVFTAASPVAAPYASRPNNPPSMSPRAPMPPPAPQHPAQRQQQQHQQYPPQYPPQHPITANPAFANAPHGAHASPPMPVLPAQLQVPQDRRPPPPRSPRTFQ